MTHRTLQADRGATARRVRAAVCSTAVIGLTGLALLAGPTASAEPVAPTDPAVSAEPAVPAEPAAADPVAPEPAAPAASDPVASDPVAAEPAAPVPAGPQLSIAVDDGRESAAEGDELTWTITVTNLGADPVDGLRISQQVPAGTSFVSADQGGTLDGGTVVWEQDVAASGVFTAQAVATVGAPVGGDLRVAAVVCASLAADQPPLVCASDSDQLPAGAAAEAAQAAAAAPGSDAATSQAAHGARWWWFAGGAGVLVLVGAAAVAVVRRRRADPAPVDAPDADPAADRLHTLSGSSPTG